MIIKEKIKRMAKDIVGITVLCFVFFCVFMETGIFTTLILMSLTIVIKKNDNS